MSMFESAQLNENSTLFSFSDKSMSIIPSEIGLDDTLDLFAVNDGALIPDFFFP